MGPGGEATDGFAVCASPSSLMQDGMAWPLAEPPRDGAIVISDPAHFARVLPTGMRLALDAPPQSVVAVPLDDGLVLVVVGGASVDAADVLSALDAASVARVARVASAHARRTELETAAARAHALLAALEQAVVTVDERRAVAEVNGAAARLLELPEGPSAASTVAGAMRRLQGTVCNQDAVHAVGAAIVADPRASVARVLWERDDDPSFLRVSSTPIDGESTSGRVWVFTDVSVEMRAARESEAALAQARESEARYRLLAENASDVVMSGDNDGVYTWISPSVTPLTGWHPTELIGRPFLDFVHPDDADDARRRQEDILKGHPVWFDVRFRTTDGGWRWVAVHARPTFDDDGNVVGRVGSWRDIEPEREQWELFARAVNALPDVAVVIVDETLRFRTVCGGIFTGAGPDGPMAWEGRTIDQALPPALRDYWKPLYEAAVAGNESVVEHQAASGRTYRMTLSPLRRPDGGRYGAVGLVIDITERAELERMKDRLIATASHELRTPVTSLSLLFEELRYETGLPEGTRRLVEVGDRSATRLRRLVEDLLLLAGSDQAGVPMVFEPVDPGQVVADAVAELGALAAQAGVRLEALGAPVPGVIADPVRLSQVVVNLVGNAIKFSQDGGMVEARTEPDGDHWTLEVRDSGIGIPEDEVHLLFDPFFRASTATDAVIGGTGLGLAVVRHLVDQHRGTVAVASSVGQGTTIKVRFPCDPTGQED